MKKSIFILEELNNNNEIISNTYFTSYKSAVMEKIYRERKTSNFTYRINIAPVFD